MHLWMLNADTVDGVFELQAENTFSDGRYVDVTDVTLGLFCVV